MLKSCLNREIFLQDCLKYSEANISEYDKTRKAECGVPTKNKRFEQTIFFRFEYKALIISTCDIPGGGGGGV